MKKIRYQKQIIITGLALFIGLIYLVLALQIINNQKIAWGVKIIDFEIGGRNISSSKNILENKWNDFVNQEITLLYQAPKDNLHPTEQEYSWSIKLTDLGFQIDYQSTINQAYQIGRQSNAFINLKEQLAALIGYYNLGLSYQINQEKFQSQTAELFKDVEKPAQNATLIFNEEIDGFSLQHSTKGVTINRERLLANLSEQIKTFSSQSIDLELILDKALIEDNEVELVRQKAEQILANQPYQLIFEGRIWKIDKKRLIDWIKFEPVFSIKEGDPDNQTLGLLLDNEKIEKYLKQIAYSINRLPTDAQLETEGNQAIVFSPALDGFEVKIAQTISQLTENILADPPTKKTTIIADKASPEILLSQVNQLGINSLIGRGVSNFAGSPKNRIHNIKTGAAKFNGLILNPGEEFSFNTLLGGSGPEQGFLPELVIKRNKTVPEYGGGLCQVSTTMFRAAVKSGLEIIQRTAHAFPVEYYYPHGFDATVYEPHPDLRFINNTPAHLLIQAVIQGSQLTFNFYGSNDGRQVIIKGPYVLEANEDGSMKTILTQEIYQDGQLINQQEFYSNYKSPDLYPVETGETNNEE